MGNIVISHIILLIESGPGFDKGYCVRYDCAGVDQTDADDAVPKLLYGVVWEEQAFFIHIPRVLP